MSYATNHSNVQESIAELFDVHLEDEDIKSFPGFISVLIEICNYSKSDDVKNVELEVEQAKMKMSQEKSLYFERQIFSNALDQVLDTEPQLTCTQVTCKCYPKHYMSAQSYINMCLTNPNHLDYKENFNTDFIESHFNPLKREFVDKAILPGICDILKDFSQCALTYCGQEFSEENVLVRIQQLPQVLINQSNDFEARRRSVQKDQQLYNKQLESYFECCLSGLNLLKEKLELQKHEVGVSSSSANYLCKKNETLLLKAKILELQILNDIYNNQIVNALQKIKKTLQEKEPKLAAQITEQSIILKSYESVGKSFENLVQEYSEVLRAIQNEKWTLEQLKKQKRQTSSLGNV